MDPKVEDKPVTAAPAAAENKDSVKDERGVDWKNRAMEYERKYKELEAKVPAKEPTPQLPEDKQKRLMEFVEDPDGYLDRHYQERKFREELPVAEDWLSKQPHFSGWDRVKDLVKEHQIGGSPMRAARTVSELLKAEALEREFSDKKRTETISKSSPDTVSRTTTVDNKTTRRDLIKQLAKAQAKGDMQESARLLDKLEDVRD